VQSFDVFCLCCLLQIPQALRFVFVLLVAEVESGQIVQGTGEVLFRSLTIIAESFIKVGLHYHSPTILVFQPVLEKIAHVSKRLEVAISTGLFPHLQILVRFAIEPPLVQRSQSVQSFIVLLFVGCFVEFYRLLKILIHNCTLLMKNP